MRRIALIGLALLAMTISASARLGMAPMAAPDGGVIEVKHGRGHGHGHMHRGRGHHYGWYRGRGHHKHRHHAAGKAFAPFAFVIPLPGRYANGSDANGRALAARPVQRLE